MPSYLCISVTFLDGRFHGRSDQGEPEWPPSPLRLMQGIVAANGDRIGKDSQLDIALRWLERQSPPMIIAPKEVVTSVPYRLSVPNNAMDIVAKSWSKGDYFGSADSNPATHRTMKTVRSTRMVEDSRVHYLWTIKVASDEDVTATQALVSAANRLVALGWGIDQVVGHGSIISDSAVQELGGELWSPAIGTGSHVLRVPVTGTLEALQKRYHATLKRIGKSGFVPTEQLTRFNMTAYHRSSEVRARPHALFELRHEDGQYCVYLQRRLIHLAGMVRHLAKKQMEQSLPPDVDDQWIERYIVGHAKNDTQVHRQLSYLPLPSIGHRHTSPAVRRVMIAAPHGDDVWLEYLSRRMSGLRLVPEYGNEFGDKTPPFLVRIYKDSVMNHYTRSANIWHSVTPVILPGHDDRRSEKTRALIKRAIVQSGIDQPCTFTWSSHSRFPKSFSAHKFDKNRKPIGYIRPNHLLTNTAVHLTLKFSEGQKIPGPVSIGAGRHLGLGIMASLPADEKAQLIKPNCDE
jgi:CRISPR-associated protein Csb2